MAIDLNAEVRVDRLEVADSVRHRLDGVASRQDLDPLIDEALDEFTAVTVTTYLPILVERRVRQRLHAHADG